MNISRSSGLYIHIPFCKKKCGYCDFYSIVDTSLTNNFIDTLISEIKSTAYLLKTDDNFDSVYIGGGTPSLLRPDQISRVLKTLSENFHLDDDCEITSEINPGTLNSKQLKELFDLGINRISIGIQSFIQEELDRLDRIHTVKDSEDAIYLCREAGFKNMNLDLIFAIPDQLSSQWNFTLEKALSFLPEHLSVYNLTFEKETPYYDKLMQGQIVQVDEQKETEFFNKAHSLLTDSGYIHYEISNYAKSEVDISRHNYKYWQHTPYLGFGPSAHSFWDNSRWANIRSVHEYISKVNDGNLPRLFEEKLTNDQMINEHIFLALRTYQGLALVEFEKLFGLNFLEKFFREIQKLLDNKLAIIKDNYFRLTEKGILICDEILPQFTI
jgi:oxygen-independent coproporphyrinogen-3 oxidase